MNYEIGFVFTDEPEEPQLYYITAESMNNEQEAVEWVKNRLTPIEIISVEVQS